jgi:hypothetical protein
MLQPRKPTHAADTTTHPLVEAALAWGFAPDVAQRALARLQRQAGGTSSAQLTAAAQQDHYLELCIAINAGEDEGGEVAAGRRE